MTGQIIPIDQVTPGQVAEIAALHELELPSLLAELGRPVLERFYMGFNQNGDSFGFLMLDNGTVRGWVVGTGDPGKLFRKVIHPFPTFVLDLFRVSIRHPRILAQLAISLASPHPDSLYPPGSAELLFIALHPEERGKGSASRLFSAFMDEARMRKFIGVTLSVEVENSPALRFYSKAGFTEIGLLSEGKYHRKRLYHAFTAF